MNNFEIFAQKLKARGLTLTPEGKQRLLDALAWIEKHEKRFDMSNWINEGATACGTTLCFAGTMVYQELGWHINTLINTKHVNGVFSDAFHKTADSRNWDYVIDTGDFGDMLLFGAAIDNEYELSNPLWVSQAWDGDLSRLYARDRIEAARQVVDRYIAAFEAV